MFTSHDIDMLRERVESVTGRRYEGAVSVQEGPGLHVRGDSIRAEITAESRPALARGFFRLMQELEAGASSVDINEEKRFDSCGCFIDCSRNAVMTVEAVKRYMDHMAALGLNLLVLYTEDTFTVPEYPHMGYLRGRYTTDEMKEIDAYAVSLGIELMPCIQTLGHLGQFLQWKPNEHLRDQPTVLMIDDEDTYRFIEAEIKAMRACVSGTRLHIGMDEAHGVGLGRYYAKHGPTDRFELLSRHLARVTAICEKYGFHPIMWSDMFFRLGSKDNEYYDMSSRVPQSVIDALPDVDLCYWDYYHTAPDWYEHMLTEHERMNANTVFAGGVWTWSGFLPQVELTYATMEPGLASCAAHRCRTVLATMWGDDGAETNPFLALSQLPMFSESCWRREGCTRETVAAAGEFLTQLPRQAYEAFGLFYPGAQDVRTGKALIYCDLLYPLGPNAQQLDASLARSARARELLAPYLERLDCRYADALFDVCQRKATLLREIRPRYLAGDREYLRHVAEVDIMALVEAYDRLCGLHKLLWERDMKRNGWEVLALRYGAVTGRLRDVRESLMRYIAGELDTLCELDEEPLDPTRKYGMQFYNVYVSPVFNL